MRHRMYSTPHNPLYLKHMNEQSIAFHVRDAGEQLAFYRPFVYHWAAGDAELLRSVPHLAGIASGDHVRQAPWSRSVRLTSSAGMIFTSFAKAREFGLGFI